MPVLDAFYDYGTGKVISQTSQLSPDLVIILGGINLDISTINLANSFLNSSTAEVKNGGAIPPLPRA
jgi:hypothetical protein